jgi:uncharacterized protein (DUF1330 family)
MKLKPLFEENGMAKGYWIARVDVKDPERYKDYISTARPAFERFGARFLVRGGAVHSLEGTARERNVVIEFASVAQALDCYNSPEYQAAAAIRQECAEAELIVVEGHDG